MNERPWVVDGELAMRRTVTLTIAFDYDIWDSREAAGSSRSDLVDETSRILLHS